MANFCSRCGARLDKETGKCPNCDKVIINEIYQTNNSIDANKYFSVKTNTNEMINKGLNKKEIKAIRKAEKKALKKAKRKKRIFLRIVAIFLCLAILTSGVAGVLVYFDIVDIPFVSSVVKLLRIVDKDEIMNDNIQITGKFTNVKVVDGNSAIAAVEDIAEQIKLDNAIEELTVKSINTIDEMTYYRLQQNYKGYPVYGRTVVVIADANGETQGLTSNAKNISDFNLTYSFNEEKIKSSIIEFLQNVYSYDNISDVVITFPEKEDLQIYEIDNRDDAVLVYVSKVQFTTNNQISTISLIIDVSNVNVINSTQTIYSDNAICYSQDGSVGFLGLQLSEEKYLMKDVERNIYIYNGGKQKVFDDNYSAQVDVVDEVVSKDNIFGNDNESDEPLNYNIAITFLSNLSKIYDFYDLKYGEAALGVLLGIYNDNFDDGNNALGGTVDITSIVSAGMPDYDSSLTNGKTGLVSMGTNKVDDIDTMAHEYTHFVTECHVDWAERKNLKYDYTGAISEAYSDIFGEIIEGYITDKDPDWVHGDRIIYDPSINNYPERVDDGRKIHEFSDCYGYEVKSSNGETRTTDYAHGHSTAISYAAYLMNTGGSSEENLTIDELADLWYRTMLTLPSNCTYSVLRENMEMTATILGFSQEKKNLISRTFDMVGIYGSSEEEESNYSTNLSVSAFDYNGNSYDNYEIIVDGTKNVALWGLFKGHYHDEIFVENTDPVQLEIPKGIYTISVTDGINTYSKQIKVRSNGENTELNFVTNFGYKDRVNTKNIIEGQFSNSDILDGAVMFNNHWYKVIEDSSITDWNEAQQYCTLLNGYLATITSKDENDFVYNYLTSDFGYESAYIGFSDHLNEGDWQWVTGEEVTYTNWNQNEPNGENTNEDYGMFYYKYSDGTWNDGDFGNRTIDSGSVFICEWGEYQISNSIQREPVEQNDDIIALYKEAADRTVSSGSWKEKLAMSVDMKISNDNSETKTTVKLNADMDIEDYSKEEPDAVKITGSANMKVMGKEYVWDTYYENGIVNYTYTEPEESSVEMEMEPSYFDFNDLSLELVENEKVTGNEISFRIPESQMEEAGIAAVQLVSGIDDIKYKSVDVNVTINENTGAIDKIAMQFQATLTYQGYKTKAKYNIDYSFLQ